MKSGSFSAAFSASLSFFSTGAGVPFGAYRPCQIVTWKFFRPGFVQRRQVFQQRQWSGRFGVVTA